MARYYAREFVGVLDGTTKPPLLADGQLINAKERRIRSTINFADRTLNPGDDVVIGVRPVNSYLISHRVLASVSLGSTTLAIGTPGNTGKYRAAAPFTTPDTPAPVATAANVAADKLSAAETMIATFGAAATPGAGLLVIDTFYTYD